MNTPSFEMFWRTKYVCRAFRFALIALALLALAGCEFNPNKRVYSVTVPENHTTPDGVLWVPVQAEPGEWFYVPFEAAVISHHAELNAGKSIKLLLPSGEVYQVTRRDGGYAFDGIVNADVACNPGMIGVAIGLGIVTLIALFIAGRMFVVCEAKEEKLATQREEVATAEAACAELQRKTTKERDEFLNEKSAYIAQRQATDDRHSAERAALDAERQSLDEWKRTITVAARDATLQRHAPTKKQWKTAAETVRARVFSGQAIGGGLLVNYFFDPRRSGVVGFQWEITLDRSVSPRIVG